MPEVFNSSKARLSQDQPLPQTQSQPQAQPLSESPVEISVLEPRGGKFSSFVCKPNWIRFKTEEEGEKIILLLRQHIVTNVPWVIAAIVMIIAPSILSYFPLLSFLPVRFQLMGVIFWYLLTLAFIFERFLGWFYNIFIVTDRRIIDIDFVGLLYRQVDECHFDDVQSLTFSQGGFVRAIFDYGYVLIQTAAEIENIQFEDVPDPAGVTKIIESLIPTHNSP